MVARFGKYVLQLVLILSSIIKHTGCLFLLQMTDCFRRFAIGGLFLGIAELALAKLIWFFILEFIFKRVFVHN